MKRVKRAAVVALGFVLVLSQICSPNLKFVENKKSQTLAQTSSITINGDEDFANWPGSGTKDDPYRVSGLTIEGATPCIAISHTTKYFVIEKCELEGVFGNEGTVTLFDVKNGEIRNSKITFGFYGIWVHSSSNITISNNRVVHAALGIKLSLVQNIVVKGNRIFRNSVGIDVEGTENSLFTDNFVFGNALRGINFANNTRNNIIHSNRLGWNGGEEPAETENARDLSNQNQWDDGNYVGNYWTDYNGVGKYTVSGSVVDRYPRVLTDTTPPSIAHLEDITVYTGEEKQLVWDVSDDFPKEKSIIQTEVVIKTDIWYGDPILFQIDEKIERQYVLTISVSDWAGNIANDSILITAIRASPAIKNAYAVFLASVGSIVGVGIYIGVLCRFGSKT